MPRPHGLAGAAAFAMLPQVAEVLMLLFAVGFDDTFISAIVFVPGLLLFVARNSFTTFGYYFWACGVVIGLIT